MNRSTLIGGADAADLEACDSEPIHIIGNIQPHGCLLAVSATSGRIVHASANTMDFLGVPCEALLGALADDALGEGVLATLAEDALTPTRHNIVRPRPFVLRRNGGSTRAEVIGHRTDDLLVFEFFAPDPAPGAVWESDLLREHIIGKLAVTESLEELADTAAHLIRDATGFDRVMVYRFAPDLHGQVIAESTVRPDSFLGMHYPASDIPSNARRQFTLNLLRTIPDIHATPVDVLWHQGGGAGADSAHPLDLTFTRLRGVAPVHVEYLSNMGVTGSLSISLVANDDLWGLVACHHYSPLRLPTSTLRFLELLGGMVSTMLQSVENTTHLRHSMRAERMAFDIERSARRGLALRDAVTDAGPLLLDMLRAEGLRLTLNGEAMEVGAVPEVSLAPDLFASEMADGVGVVDNLASRTPMSPEQVERAAGAACLSLSDDGEDTLVVVRAEHQYSIDWAGPPGKLATHSDDGVRRLSPRGSFALWCEERRGRCRPFDEADLEVLRVTRRALVAVNSAEREQRAEQRRQKAELTASRLRVALLDANRESALSALASSLAHELTQPLASVSNYVNAARQELANSGVALPDPVEALMDESVSEASRASDLVRRLRNFIGEGELLRERVDVRAVLSQGVDVALAAAESRPRVIIDVPPGVDSVWGDPVQLALVVTNLVRNAERAVRDHGDGLIDVCAEVDNDGVAITVRDNGAGIAPERLEHLFVPFVDDDAEGMGIGLALCHTIVAAHGGRICVQSGAAGTTFVVTLPTR